jgi:hypothetical protein
MLPSAAMSICALAGTVIGPPSPSTGRPLRVTSWPSPSMSSTPLRV